VSPQLEPHFATPKSLAPATERYDRGRKLEHYRKIPSLAEYVLVAQDARRIEWYTRQPSGLWSYSDTQEGQQAVELVSIGCTLPLDEVYDRIQL
jgi:Uma2 family endonuclease